MRVVAVLLLILSLSTPPRLVEVAPGLVVIVWENDGADTVQVFNTSNKNCPYPTIQEGLIGLGTTLTQVPEGPPYEGKCALKGGDQLYLLRYRDGSFRGQSGPFTVPHHIYLPRVSQ